MVKSNLLQGEQVRLTAVSPNDLPELERWWHNAGFLRLFDAVPAYPKTKEQLKKRVEEGQDGETTFLFGIRPVAGDGLIGLVELDGILWSHRSAWISIGIGDETMRGQGYGKEAMGLGLNFAFNELNLHRVTLTVFSYNEAAIALYQKLGFTHEGTFRDHLERDGRRHDMLLFGLLHHEWRRKESDNSA